MSTSRIPVLQTKEAIRGEMLAPTSTISKVERYRWVTVDRPGKFTYIDKTHLHVDHRYQRDEIRETTVNGLASEWSWLLCGALAVVRRDGKLWIVDGQHRWLAACKRADISKLPVLIFELEHSLSTEARSFVDLNSHRNAVSGQSKFKAWIVAGDPDAIGVQKLLESTGHKAGAFSGVKTVRCVTCLLKLYRRDHARMTRLWPLVSDICAAHQVMDNLVVGLWGAEVVAESIQSTLTESPYRELLIGTGAAVLNAEIRRLEQELSKGGERICALAIIKWINKQRMSRTRKLPI